MLHYCVSYILGKGGWGWGHTGCRQFTAPWRQSQCLLVHVHLHWHRPGDTVVSTEACQWHGVVTNCEWHCLCSGSTSTTFLFPPTLSASFSSSHCSCCWRVNLCARPERNACRQQSMFTVACQLSLQLVTLLFIVSQASYCDFYYWPDIYTAAIHPHPRRCAFDGTVGEGGGGVMWWCTHTCPHTHLHLLYPPHINTLSIIFTLPL